ncbi:hypothetical protein AA313_de0205703 [Arthrobotrys entomopaga]|nr:hypothetical protein AA313_de0205703 [Arthrobotrys entomopaga]
MQPRAAKPHPVRAPPLRVLAPATETERLARINQVTKPRKAKVPIKKACDGCKAQKSKEILENIRSASSSKLRKIMNLLQDSGESTVEELLIFMRNDGNSILSARDISPEPATTDLTLLANSQVEEPGQTVLAQMALGIIDDRPLMDMVLTAEPWTTVIDDNELVAHLISAYIAWDAVAWNWLDIEIFLDAMAHKDFEFCSPLLVNSILALACHMSIRIPIRSDPHNPNTLGYRFIEQALKLWHEDSQEPKLTVILSGMILCEVLSVNGKDELGYLFFQSAVSLYEKLSEKRTAASKNPRAKSPNSDSKMERALATASWGLFRLSTFYSLLNKKGPVMKVPTMSLEDSFRSDDTAPENVEDEGQETSNVSILSNWRPYPFTQPVEPCRLEESIRACTDLCMIIHNFRMMQVGENNDLMAVSMSVKRDVHQNLMEWKAALPEGLKIGETAAPFVVTPHLGYSQLLIELYSAPLDTDGVEPEELAAFTEETTAWYTDGKTSLFSMMDKYEKQYSFVISPETMMLGPVYATKITVEELTAATTPKENPGNSSTDDCPTTETAIDDPDPTIEELASNYEKTINWLCDVGDQFFTAKLYARGLQLTGENLNMTLGDPTRHRLEKIFSPGEDGKSKWIDQVYKANSILTMRLAHQADTVLDVISQLDNLSV